LGVKQSSPIPVSLIVGITQEESLLEKKKKSAYVTNLYFNIKTFDGAADLLLL